LTHNNNVVKSAAPYAWVRQVMVVGSGERQLGALVVPDVEAVEAFLGGFSGDGTENPLTMMSKVGLALTLFSRNTEYTEVGKESFALTLFTLFAVKSKHRSVDDRQYGHRSVDDSRYGLCSGN
jgi:hypothetical protein